jgi:hypothetical protein
MPPEVDEQESKDLVSEAEIGKSVSLPGITPSEETESEEVTPRKRGRPKGSKNKAKAPEMDMTQETLNGLIVGIFNVLAVRGGEHWALSPVEANMLTDVSYKFIVSMADKLGKWVGIGSLILAWSVIILPRLAESKKQEKKQEKKEISQNAPVITPTLQPAV